MRLSLSQGLNYPEIDTLDDDYFAYWTQLNQSDERVRFVAILNIADEEREELLPWLHYAVQHDPAELVRLEAAKRLEGWEDEDSIKALVTALYDDSEHVVDTSTQSLSEAKQSQSADVLGQFLDQPQISVKIAILRALKPLRAVQLYTQIEAHPAHENPLVRREAVSALSWLQQPQGIDVLAKIVEKETDVETRRIATGGLAYAKQATPIVQQALQVALVADDWQLRVESALTIRRLKLVALEQILIDSLQDNYWQVRIATVRSLGLIQSQHAFEELALNFNFEISNLKKEVALALGEIGGDQAEQLLNQHAEDPDPEVRKAIRISLNQIQDKQI